MQAESTLELFAELFVAFAGFTGLAGVLTRSGAETPALSQELRLLVEYSLVFLVLSVLPLVSFHAGLSEPISWRIACALSSLATATYYALRFSSLRTWSSITGATGVFWFTMLTDCALALALLVAALQLASLAPSSLYLFHLLWGLLGTALSFGRPVKPIWDASATSVGQRGPDGG